MTNLSLPDYFTQLAQNIKAGKNIQLGPILAELETYDGWRKFCEEQPDAIFSITTDPEENLQTLLELAENPQFFLTETASTDPETVLSQSYPTEAITEARKQTYSSLIEQQQLRVAESVKKRRKITQQFFREYQKKLFEWSPEKQTEIAREIQQAERQAPLRTFEEMRTGAINLARKYGDEQVVKEVSLLIDNYAPQIDIPEIERPIQIAREVNRIVVENSDITTPEVVAQSVESGLPKEQVVGYARIYTTVSQIRKEGINSFSKPAAEIVATAFPNVPPAAAHASLVQALEKAVDDDGIVGGVVRRLGEKITTQRDVQNFIRTGARQLAQKTPSGGAVVTGIVTDIFGSEKKHSEVLTNYIAASYHNKGETFSFMEYLIVLERQKNPDTFSLGSNGLLQWGAQIGLKKAAKTTLGAGAKVTAEKVGLSLGIKGLGAAIGGLPGWIVAVAGSKLLEWGGKIITGAISFAGYALSGGMISSILQGKPASLTDTLVLFPVILIAALVLLFAVPILPFLNFADFPQTNRNVALVTSMGGGVGPDGPGAPGSPGNSPGGTMGQISYTGPQPAGDLQCTNYNVSSRQFCDDSGCITGNPLSSGQTTIMNGILESYGQLGLYNCLLGCPQSNVSFYSGGSSPWYGWAAATRSVVLYDGFFTASGGAQEQARLLAHEMAHTYTQLHPDVQIAFEQEGYCGRLCTYPSGNLGNCSSSETARETFAESAAMYIIGQDLQSLCPKGYAFIDRMFRSCNP